MMNKKVALMILFLSISNSLFCMKSASIPEVHQPKRIGEESAAAVYARIAGVSGCVLTLEALLAWWAYASFSYDGGEDQPGLSIGKYAAPVLMAVLYYTWVGALATAWASLERHPDGSITLHDPDYVGYYD